MEEEEEETVARLIKAKKDIKRKFASLKANTLESEEHLKKTYKPLTESLRNIITSVTPIIKTEQPKIEFKKDDDEEEEEDLKTPVYKKKKEHIEPEVFKTPVTKKKKRHLGRHSEPEVFESYTEPEEEEEEERSPTITTPIITDASFIDYLDQFARLPRVYIEGYIRDTENKFDTGQQGVHHDTTLDKYYIGNSEIHFSDKTDNIVINGKEYKGTIGLYELLFKKNPTDYNTEDEKNYRQILLSTDAVRAKHDRNRQIAGNPSHKYRTVVAPLLFDRTSTPPSSRAAASKLRTTSLGRGLMTYNNKPIEYVYWNDPNELVDRLRLLIASKNVGNDGHSNEINSIIEELREANIII